MESLKNQITYLSSQSQWVATDDIHSQGYLYQTRLPSPMLCSTLAPVGEVFLPLNPDLEAPGRGLDKGVRAAQEGSLLRDPESQAE